MTEEAAEVVSIRFVDHVIDQIRKGEYESGIGYRWYQDGYCNSKIFRVTFSKKWFGLKKIVKMWRCEPFSPKGRLTALHSIDLEKLDEGILWETMKLIEARNDAREKAFDKEREETHRRMQWWP